MFFIEYIGTAQRKKHKRSFSYYGFLFHNQFYFMKYKMRCETVLFCKVFWKTIQNIVLLCKLLFLFTTFVSPNKHWHFFLIINFVSCRIVTNISPSTAFSVIKYWNHEHFIQIFRGMDLRELQHFVCVPISFNTRPFPNILYQCILWKRP